MRAVVSNYMHIMNIHAFVVSTRAFFVLVAVRQTEERKAIQLEEVDPGLR